MERDRGDEIGVNECREKRVFFNGARYLSRLINIEERH